ncbi:hypothetical protein AQUCO_01300828v1 [Aquilegia coerulea]|uniref:AATF leucine zipper-containing domain-containing protein n=1 Tax=Aquilegia coerulea TaxID=218851 RepID=A0A2G5E3N0_AQUCA|nr:hypothetical protein AQUCO_01300828v1 [Aquilegia coerulea]
MGLVSKHSKRKSEPEYSTEDESDLESDKEFDEQEDTEEEYDDENNLKNYEAQKDADLEELEKELLSLRNGDSGILVNLKRHKDEDLLKGQAVRNQKALWDKTLELRFSLQKAFSSSNKLPQEPTRSLFCGSDDAISKAYVDLITSSEKTLDCFVELQEAMLEKNPTIGQTAEGSKKGVISTDVPSISNVGKDDVWSRIQQLHSRVAPFRDSSIDKWQRKSQVMTGVAGYKGKLQAFSQNISEQVAGYMRDPSRMIKRMQLRRPVVGVFGAVAGMSGNTKEEVIICRRFSTRVIGLISVHCVKS